MSNGMKPFCLLADPVAYKALDWDLAEDRQGCAEWLEVFETVFAEILHHCHDVYGENAADRMEVARRAFAAEISALRSNPASYQEATGKQLNLLELDRIRDRVLRDNGLPDAFCTINGCGKPETTRRTGDYLLTMPRVLLTGGGLANGEGRRWG